jgi:hypothetical protein
MYSCVCGAAGELLQNVMAVMHNNRQAWEQRVAPFPRRWHLRK